MRKIIHIDMDAFFAAVEMRDNPKLRNVPMAVGGSSDRRGVLCTANYLARKFGVRSALPTAHALKLCPQLVLVKPNMQKYKQASLEVFKIFHEYTDQVEPMSMDEPIWTLQAPSIVMDQRLSLLKKFENGFLRKQT